MINLEIIKSEETAETTGISNIFNWSVGTVLQNFSNEDLNVLINHYKYKLVSEGEGENIQSHANTARGNRQLSLAALAGQPAPSRGVKLPLLQNTRSIF